MRGTAEIRAAVPCYNIANLSLTIGVKKDMNKRIGSMLFWK